MRSGIKIRSMTTNQGGLALFHWQFVHLSFAGSRHSVCGGKLFSDFYGFFGNRQDQWNEHNTCRLISTDRGGVQIVEWLPTQDLPWRFPFICLRILPTRDKKCKIFEQAIWISDKIKIEYKIISRLPKQNLLGFLRLLHTSCWNQF